MDNHKVFIVFVSGFATAIAIAVQFNYFLDINRYRHEKGKREIILLKGMEDQRGNFWKAPSLLIPLSFLALIITGFCLVLKIYWPKTEGFLHLGLWLMALIIIVIIIINWAQSINKDFKGQ